MSSQKRPARRGQVAVETAIILPFFVFLVLSILQLTLMYQAQLMTKFAAYKAVRAGSIRRADVAVMKRAALNVLVPILGRGITVGGGTGMYQTRDAAHYAVAYQRFSRSSLVSPVDVTICAPTNIDILDFDAPKKIGIDKNIKSNADLDWKGFEKSKLAIQVTTNFELVIPFANAMMWWAVYAQTPTAQVARANEVIRLGKREQNVSGGGNGLNRIMAGRGVYLIPIRASYVMRMQSNFAVKPPKTNKCVVGWQ